ncbi:flagellar basal-body MS-ring/collar protein FliF [Tunturiibacter gelidiferens]|uniref:Flagellar M-ring protein n=1 Tax=Tunturiibacter gelidiferens TaxID=3069689 RepID=A0AAU7YX41_9BACT
MAETEQVGGAGIQRAGQAGAGVAGGTPLEKTQAMVSAMRERLMAMPAAKRTWLIAAGVFLAAVCAGMVWLAGRPDWRVLFNGLDGKDVQQVSQELAAAGIPYETTADGAGVQVPADMLDKARMEVAAKGMPQTGRLGFELFDKPNWVGSEFDERVNYQRALEGELEHTIGTLGVVKSARVHLVLPQPSLFTAEEKVAKASVVLKLKRAALDPEQADAIRSLVAGSVENLSADQVTLVDADGRVNFKPRSSNAAEADAEQAMEAKLVAMLEPLAGRDNVRATVNVSYDEGSEERTDEVYDPTEVATLSMQKSEQVSTGRGGPSGIPGTASNSPGASPEGAVAGSQVAAAPGTPPLLQKQTQALPVYPQQNGAQGQSIHQENETYGVTKHLVHTEQGPGRVRRVSAAVVVNDRSVTEGAGKLEHVVWKPRSAEEMHRLEELAQAAVGYDARRGDQVVMQNVSFSTNAPEVKPPTMDRLMEEVRGLLHTQPGLMRTAVIGLCGVLLVLFVLRPVATQMTATLREPMLLPAETAHVGMNTDEEQLLASSETPDEMLPRTRNKTYQLQQGIFEQVSEHIRREPGQSTRLIEAWIGTSEERS